MFKINDISAPLYLKELLPIPKVVNYNLRNKQDLQPPLCRLVLFQCSFIPTGIRQWNMLPEKVQKLPSVEALSRIPELKREYCFITMENDGHQFIMLECELVVVH